MQRLRLKEADAGRAARYFFTYEQLDPRQALKLGEKMGKLDSAMIDEKALEAEAARLAGVTVGDEGDGLDRAVLSEQRADGGFIGRERQVTNVDLAH